MDEETLEAAACAIAFLGEAALRTSAANLVTRAGKVAVEAEAEGAANADRQGGSAARTEAISALLEAAAALAQGVEAESAARKQAVSGLLGAATALEAVLGAGLDELGGLAADLARQCRDYLQAAEAIDKLRSRAAAGEQRQSAPRWWPFWRRRRPRPSDLEQGDIRQRLLSTGSTLADLDQRTVNILTNEVEKRAGRLVELVEDVVVSAHGLAVPDQTLREARHALHQADDPSSLRKAVNGIEAVAMGLKETCSARLIKLRNPATELVAACQEYLDASDAMAAVQRAATERARARESALAPIQNAPPPPSPDPGLGDQRKSGWLGCVLGGSLSLAPYLFATNGDKNFVLGYDDRWSINLALSLWWSVVASGALCSSYARSSIEVCYAQLAARIGVYGMNVFIIFFLYWMLGIHDDRVRSNCLWFASALHLLFFVVACYRRDP